MQRLIILRGCMGVGKSTVAKKFRNFSNRFAYIKVDDFKNIFEHSEKETRPVFHGAANAAMEHLLEEEYSVIMEGVFQNPAFIEQAVEIASKHNVKSRVFELTASLETLVKRDERREEVKSGVREPLGKAAIQNIYDKLNSKPYSQAIKIDTEHIPVGEVIEIINKNFGN